VPFPFGSAKRVAALAEAAAAIIATTASDATIARRSVVATEILVTRPVPRDILATYLPPLRPYSKL